MLPYVEASDLRGDSRGEGAPWDCALTKRICEPQKMTRDPSTVYLPSVTLVLSFVNLDLSNRERDPRIDGRDRSPNEAQRRSDEADCVLTERDGDLTKAIRQSAAAISRPTNWLRR